MSRDSGAMLDGPGRSGDNVGMCIWSFPSRITTA